MTRKQPGDDVTAVDHARGRQAVKRPALTRAPVTISNVAMKQPAVDPVDAMGVSPATVKRDWLSAKVWLHRRLTRA